MAAQFTLYVDANAYADGELILTWESKIDRKVYKNDCWGLHDLSTFMGEICDPRELYELNRILEEFRGQKKETPNYNKL